MGRMDDLMKRRFEQKVDEEMEKGMDWFAAASKVSGADVPVPFPIVTRALTADAELGRDMNGSTLHSERISWLDEEGVTGEERRLMKRLLVICNRVRNEVRAEEMEARKQDK